MSDEDKVVSVNGRDYAWPKQTAVVVCIDGSEPAYIEQAIADGVMPYMEKALKWLRTGAQPSETVKSLLKKSGIWKQYQNK